MTAAVDADVVVAWQTPSHVFHADAVRMIGDATPPLCMSELNLAEVLAGLDRSDWTAAIETLAEMGFEFVNATADEIAEARLDGKLGMPDACVLATARAMKADAVLSFDAALAAAGSAHGFSTQP